MQEQGGGDKENARNGVKGMSGDHRAGRRDHADEEGEREAAIVQDRLDIK